MTSRKVFDALLVLQYQSGDSKALDLLVKRHHERLCRQAYWYTRDMEASKDIVQDCWGIIIRKIGGLRDANAFESWAMRIVTRKSLNFLNRDKKAQRQISEIPSTKEDANYDEEHQTNLIQIKKAIQQLPKDHQVVLRLFYTEEYSLKAISSILDVSVGTVKSRLFHAREKLKIIVKK
ncbi:RNA polymerase sigma factor [Flavobacteriaceae bacterium TP-CH-4]|uniref:RNA polymerase sigma factor n=1 Tax=Pelagihabitans pacificus TaxID=2696054 RepID=A0A967AVL8_9FLAO|nr:RNA polymerase sigma factor [Pelagihabitans pacificus]NHF61221.1 RNA polymerase sigma factor [Pelagihabitans pacificus]